ncbi:DUF2339 domain-containing protein [Candidatus Parcubacteria bacterium]|nr:DUF2339 domain-containing protein [Candidatus Parcubacteria bacterium]
MDFSIIFFIFGVVLFFMWFNLLRRVKKLERGVGRSIIPQEAPLSASQAEEPSLSPSFSPADVQEGPIWSDKLVAWLKDDWLLKLGALLLLIGFGWLATYAFLNNWIGPMGRIVLGIIAGACFLLLGWWRIRARLHQGSVFLVLGSTTILLTVFAAREVYGFFTPISALGIMFLSTALVAFVSVKYKSFALALASLILAGVAPLFTNTATPNYIGLFFYLFIITLGTIWIVMLTGKRELLVAALALIVAYSVPHVFSLVSSDKGTLLLFAYAFSAVFFIVHTAGILKSKESPSDLLVGAGNGIFILAWIMVGAPKEWQSLILSAWMIVFAVGAFLIFKLKKTEKPFYVYAGVGIAMLAVATAAELEGPALTIAYTLESGLISLLVYYVLRNARIAQAIGALLICPVVMSFNSISSSAWSKGFLHKDFFVLLILAGAFLGLGLFFLRRIEGAQETKINTAFLSVGSFYAYIALWLSLHAEIKNSALAVMIALVVYTIIGLIAYLYGLINSKRRLQVYGGLLLGFVVLRLLLVDVWKMELAGRIITFFLVGALLVSTAFLGRRKIIPNQ